MDDHDPRDCITNDPDCPRYACRVYREGHRDGWDRGHDHGFAEGYAAGYPDGMRDCPGPHGG